MLLCVNSIVGKMLLWVRCYFGYNAIVGKMLFWGNAIVGKMQLAV